MHQINFFNFKHIKEKNHIYLYDNFASRFYTDNGVTFGYLFIRFVSLYLDKIERPSLFTYWNKSLQSRVSGKMEPIFTSLLSRSKLIVILVGIVLQQVFLNKFSGFTSKMGLFMHPTLFLNIPITLY